ncbi:MAG: tRNA (5-methylaminomethyl-2-thiouridine)(34)-methyltransferase MnmD [Bacteroidota bacterium]
MNNPFLSQVIKTEDGSHTLQLLQHNEQYHSLNGAMQESKHIFLDKGYNHFNPAPEVFYILEVGLGTGLNALLTAQKSIKEKTRVFYEATEPFPLSAEVTGKLNYPGMLEDQAMKDVFAQIHTCEENRYTNISDFFFIRCFCTTIQEVNLCKERYHLVYFDAFGPDTQPEMWTQEIFEKMFYTLKKRGGLVTYSAKGSVKRALKAAGFEVEGLPGPPGKREITRAIKP